MKNLFLTLCFSFFSLTLAQQKDLIVNYSSKISYKDHENLNWFSNSNVSQVKIKQIIKSITDDIKEYQLKIHNETSTFEYQEKINNDQSSGMMFFSFSAGSNWYVNTLDSLKMKEVNMMGKEYLITDSLEVFDWKVTREKKKVFNIETRKATAIKDSVEYTAWYAPSIPIPHGPNAITGLPGLILELEIYKPNVEGKPIYLFWVNGMETKENLNIIKPNKGKAITQKQYNDEMKAMIEKRKQMFESGVDRD